MVSEISFEMRSPSTEIWARAFALLALLVLIPICVGCGNEPESERTRELVPFASLAGRFIPNQPVTVVPDQFWEADDDSRTWSFGGWANLVVFVGVQGAAGPLTFSLTPDETTSLMHFQAMWDGESLLTEPVKAEGGLVIEVAPSQLTPGLHRLKVGRIRAADDPGTRKTTTCRFTALEFGSEDGEVLNPDHGPRHELIRAFLEDGVTGESRQRHGGVLVQGRQTVRSTVETPSDASISFVVSSMLSKPTRFSVDVDGVEHHVKTGAEPVELSVAVSEGLHELSMTAEGSENGLYLWGAPHIDLPSPAVGGGPVILVTLDTTRKDVLSVYGGDPKASPNIARLAEKATVYQNAWATSPWTLPSHASLFTGLYPTRHGAGVSKTRLEISIPTLAELARDAGYRTAGFSGGALSASRWGLARGFDLYRDPDAFETRGDRQTDYVESFVRRYSAQPFLLFVNYFDPHAMYQAPEEFESLFDVDRLRQPLENLAEWSDVSQGNAAVWRAVVNGEVEPTPEALAFIRGAYQAEVAFMDHQIGRLLDTLVEEGIFDSATIILVADHGEFLGEGGFFSHACRLDTELTEIPLLIKWPGQTTGRRDDRLVSQVDLFGTMLDALGIAGSSRDGLRLGPKDRNPIDRRTTVFMEEHENRIHPLFEFMTIAPHIYGLQELDRRQVVWDGGDLCSERAIDDWRDAKCEVGWEQRMIELATVAALPLESELSDGDVGLTDDMREHLEALGYIR